MRSDLKFHYRMNLGTYLTNVQAEIHNIRWPSRKQAITYTILVVVVSLLVAAYLGALDLVFTKAVEFLIASFR